MRWILVFVMFFILNANDRTLKIYKQKYGNEKKVALVIGNSAYSGNLSRLKNPVNDARDIKSALKSIGFEVLYAYNINFDKFR